MNYEQLVALCQDIDIGLWALHHRAGKHNSSHVQHTNQSQPHTKLLTVAPTAPAISRPEPMDVSTSGAGHEKISEQEQAARIRDGLCLYCGGAGHMACHCPNKMRNPFRATSAQVEQFPNISSNPNPNMFANPDPKTLANPYGGSS